MSDILLWFATMIIICILGVALYHALKDLIIFSKSLESEESKTLDRIHRELKEIKEILKQKDARN